MKLREGSYRTIYNNIWVNCASSPCFHMGNEDNHDRYFNNITVMNPLFKKVNHDRLFKLRPTGNEIYTLICPPVRSAWLEEVDRNCFSNTLGHFSLHVCEREGEGRREMLLEEWQGMGFDQNSLYGDPLFVDPASNNYQVRPESPALKVGFIHRSGAKLFMLLVLSFYVLYRPGLKDQNRTTIQQLELVQL